MKTFNHTSIKHLRMAHKLTQSAFARKVGITRQLVFNMENCISKPDISTLEKIAAPFDLGMDFFFDENNAATHHDSPQEVE